LIDGLVISEPPVFRDNRGAVMQVLRSDAPHFAGFGELYFSVVNPGVFKGWKRHRVMTMALTVPCGRVLLVVYDDRTGSSSRGSIEEIELSPESHKLVTVPPMVWTGFAGVSDQPAVLVNCASILHRADEADNRAMDDPAIPYRWQK
jgi:dTDP-4-dehydrorhamnose 3,5-epimerase